METRSPFVAIFVRSLEAHSETVGSQSKAFSAGTCQFEFGEVLLGE